MIGDHAKVVHGSVELPWEDYVVLIVLRELPDKWQSLHAHAQIKGVDRVLLTDLSCSLLRLPQELLHHLILCDGLVDRHVIVDGRLFWRSNTSGGDEATLSRHLLLPITGDHPGTVISHNYNNA